MTDLDARAERVRGVVEGNHGKVIGREGNVMTVELPRALIECLEGHAIATADELRAILARRRAVGGDVEAQKIFGNVCANLIAEIGSMGKLPPERA